MPNPEPDDKDVRFAEAVASFGDDDQSKPERFNEAVWHAKAMAWFDRNRGDDDQSLAGWWAHRFRDRLPDGPVEETPEWCDQFLKGLIEVAREQAWAWDALFKIAKVYRDRDDVPRPAILFDWLTDVVEAYDPANDVRRQRWGAGKSDARRPRKGADRTAGRNANVALLVAFIVAGIGIKPTRYIESDDRYSACDAVAEAYGLTYTTVAGIWSNRHNSNIPDLADICAEILKEGCLAS